MIILDAIVNVFVFLMICTVACGMGMLFSLLFSFLILCAKRKSADYDKWEYIVVKLFWKIIFIGVIVALCVCAYILK